MRCGMSPAADSRIQPEAPGRHRAQVADLVAMPAGGEVRLGVLALEYRAPADVARHDVVDRPELLLHRGRL